MKSLCIAVVCMLLLTTMTSAAPAAKALHRDKRQYNNGLYGYYHVNGKVVSYRRDRGGNGNYPNGGRSDGSYGTAPLRNG
ncbi:hypothetical protein RvY_06821 [Ramazzottius varieornatus]|uniref:Uncharacterized protein n=1 Tax=Ramazzottius varieornatus TaxID=947166 RepID=A0A1D1UZW5_RAMVA|nr:hypothetical protein RvY_06821 [Ramazzottius varieornatus]